MIRCINASGEIKLKFVIDFCYDFDDKIEASSNPDFSSLNLDQMIEEIVREDYDLFMSMVAYKFKDMGFEVLEGPNFSNRKDSKSCYFVICKEDDYDSLTVEFVLNIRISDHRLSRYKGSDKSWDRFKARDKYQNKELENYKELNADNPDDMYLGNLEIIIGNQSYLTCKDALTFIVNKVKKEMNKHN